MRLLYLNTVKPTLPLLNASIMQVLSKPQLQALTDEQESVLYARMSRMVDRVDFHLDELAIGFSNFYKSYHVEEGESRLVSRSLESLTSEGRIVLSASPDEWASALFFEPLACSANALLHECRIGVYLLVWITDRGDAEVALYTGSSVDMWFRWEYCYSWHEYLLLTSFQVHEPSRIVLEMCFW